MTDNSGTTVDEGSQDSSVINELRSQLRDANKRVEKLTAGKLATDRQVLSEAGFANITPLYEKELKDNPEIDPRSFLESYGLVANEPVAEDDGAEPEAPVDDPTPNSVTDLAQRVASAGNPNADPARQLEEKLLAANSRSELMGIINANLPN